MLCHTEIDWNGLIFTGELDFGSGRCPSISGEMYNNIEGWERFTCNRFEGNVVQGLAYHDGQVSNFWGTLE